MKQRWGLACVWLLWIPLSLPAQATNGASPTELIQALLDRIEKLERRVAELEGANGAARAGPVENPAPATVALKQTAAPAQAGEKAQAHSAQHGHPAAQAAQEAQPSYPALKLAGFSDINFSATDLRGSRSGFNEGQFTLHLSSALSPKVSAFGEITFTARPDAGTGLPAATGFNAEVERVIVRFDQSDHFKVSFGRYHTPINWWNTAYHHGQWLQTSVARPEMTQFGGRFIPVHFVGALVEGAFPARGLNLNYNLGLGNGRGSVISRGGDAGDNNNHRAWVANLFVKPDRFYGLQVGGSVYNDKVGVAGARQFYEWITSGHIVWAKETPEVIAEFANVHHREVGRSHTFNSQAYYIQAGYRLPWGEKLWKPYYRFEYIHIPRTDVVFQGVPGLAGSVVGMRYDISDFAALKLEYRRQRRPGQPRATHTNGAFLQTSFTF